MSPKKKLALTSSLFAASGICVSGTVFDLFTPAVAASVSLGVLLAGVCWLAILLRDSFRQRATHSS